MRARHDLTQTALAERVQVSRQTINAIEQGTYNLSTILTLRIAHIFGKPLEEIFELEPGDWEQVGN